MDAQLLENLLHQEESATLDFKRGQYTFVKANNAQKGELLKDVLAFANAWRQTDAHILIGVEEMRGARSILCGIPPTEHLLDHQLQQFVHGKTNRELSFSYAPIPFEGVEIGVITIPIQERPIYLLNDYGALKANVVYIRRGSSTGEAPPDEVLRMGASTLSLAILPVLNVEFADIKSRKKYGLTLQVLCQPREIPVREEIPLFGNPGQTFLGASIDFRANEQNRNYYRDLADWIRDFGYLCPIGLVVSNPSSITAENVVVTLQVESASGLTLLDDDHKKPIPSSSRWNFMVPLARRYSGRIDVAQYGSRFEIRAELGNIQPGTAVWSKDAFHIGARTPQTVQVGVTISANNLREPMKLEAEIEIKVKSLALGVSEILASAKAEE